MERTLDRARMTSLRDKLYGEEPVKEKKVVKKKVTSKKKK